MTPIVFRDCTLLDCTGADPAPRSTVIVEGSRIARVARGSEPALPRDADVIDCGGRTLMAGLTDAHVHEAIIETDAGKIRRESAATIALRIKNTLEQTLQAGFTTVRDAFGLDWGFAQATERGLVRGPRILFTGGCLSQTGGHGDWREPHHQHAPVEGIHGLVAMPRICDSPDDMRRAARDVLRTGAHGIKLMAGGGCMSPTDELEHTQFTVEEMSAACYEATTVGKVSLAHVYTPRGILNALRAGVRSIEHGNFLDEESAAAMHRVGAFFVPTLTTYTLISAHGEAQGIPRRMIDKIDKAKAGGLESLKVAQAAGLEIASGSDVLAAMQPFKALELGLKAQVLGAHGAILSATRTNARLFGLADEIGTVEEGKLGGPPRGGWPAPRRHHRPAGRAQRAPGDARRHDLQEPGEAGLSPGARRRLGHDRLQALALLLDALDQPELGAAAVEVVSAAPRGEVRIAAQVIREETHPDHQRDEQARERQLGALRRRQEAAGSCEVALHQGREHLGPQRDARQVALVFGRGAGGSSHEVAEVVEHQAGHHGVEIDHAERLARPVVEQHVVELGVVVGDALRKDALLLEVEQSIHQRLARPDEVELGPAAGQPPPLVTLRRREQRLEARPRVVEARNRLVQTRAGEVGQLRLEVAEGLCQPPGRRRRSGSRRGCWRLR